MVKYRDSFCNELTDGPLCKNYQDLCDQHPDPSSRLSIIIVIIFQQILGDTGAIPDQ